MVKPRKEPNLHEDAFPKLLKTPVVNVGLYPHTQLADTFEIWDLTRRLEDAEEYEKKDGQEKLFDDGIKVMARRSGLPLDFFKGVHQNLQTNTGVSAPSTRRRWGPSSGPPGPPAPPAPPGPPGPPGGGGSGSGAAAGSSTDGAMAALLALGDGALAAGSGAAGAAAGITGAAVAAGSAAGQALGSFFQSGARASSYVGEFAGQIAGATMLAGSTSAAQLRQMYENLERARLQREREHLAGERVAVALARRRVAAMSTERIGQAIVGTELYGGDLPHSADAMANAMDDLRQVLGEVMPQSTIDQLDDLQVARIGQGLATGVAPAGVAGLAQDVLLPIPQGPPTSLGGHIRSAWIALADASRDVLRDADVAANVQTRVAGMTPSERTVFSRSQSPRTLFGSQPRSRTPSVVSVSDVSERSMESLGSLFASRAPSVASDAEVRRPSFLPEGDNDPVAPSRRWGLAARTATELATIGSRGVAAGSRVVSREDIARRLNEGGAVMTQGARILAPYLRQGMELTMDRGTRAALAASIMTGNIAQNVFDVSADGTILLTMAGISAVRAFANDPNQFLDPLGNAPYLVNFFRKAMRQLDMSRLFQQTELAARVQQANVIAGRVGPEPVALSDGEPVMVIPDADLPQVEGGRLDVVNLRTLALGSGRPVSMFDLARPASSQLTLFGGVAQQNPFRRRRGVMGVYTDSEFARRAAMAPADQAAMDEVARQRLAPFRAPQPTLEAYGAVRPGKPKLTLSGK